jgi:hypothetical protein
VERLAAAIFRRERALRLHAHGLHQFPGCGVFRVAGAVDTPASERIEGQPQQGLQGLTA